jgi:FemAB-related protein (PEP-CTERM system-associated)
MKPVDTLLVPFSGLTVRSPRDDDHARWDDFVARCSTATFFHRIGWKSIVENVFHHRTHYLLAERGDEIVGVLPLAEIKSRLFGHALVSLPFAVYGGAAAVDEATHSALIEAAVWTARGLGVQHLELRNRAPQMAEWPRQDLYVTFRKEILPDVEANMLAIPRKQRAMVRKGIQRGLVTEIDAGVDRFFDLYADNVHRHGTPAFPKKYFEALVHTFGSDCETQIVLSPQGKPVSGVLTFYFHDEVLPYYAGDVPAARELAANDFKYWELMRRACERGYKLFDFGRSKCGTGSFDFKKNWGFEPEPLHYEYQLLRTDRIPQNNPSNPKYRVFISMWRRLPRGVANMLGPHIVRHLG